MRGIIKTSVSTSFFLSLSLSCHTTGNLYISDTSSLQLSFFQRFSLYRSSSWVNFPAYLARAGSREFPWKLRYSFPFILFFFFPHLSLVIFSNFLPYSFLFSSSNAPYIFFLNPCYRSSIFPRKIPLCRMQRVLKLLFINRFSPQLRILLDDEKNGTLIEDSGDERVEESLRVGWRIDARL